MKRTITVASGVLLCLALAGCSSRSSSSLDAKVERQDVQIQRLSSQVGQVEQGRPGQAEMWAQMQSMRQEVNALNGKLYDVQNTGEVAQLRERVARLEAIVRQMGSQLAINVDSLGGSSAPAYSPPPVSSYPAPAVPDSASAYTPAPVSTPSTAYNNPAPADDPVYTITPGSTPAVSDAGPGLAVTPDGDLRSGTAEASGSQDMATSLYDSGIKAFDQRRYKDAVVTFKDFTSTYPKHNLTGNAYFWEGESYFQLKDYPRAALAYQEVISKFPGSPKVQSSMLKQGISLHHANKKPAARERLQELVKRYPSSPEATRAKQFLADNK